MPRFHLLDPNIQVELNYPSPNSCPYCHHLSVLQPLQHFGSRNDKYYVIFYCPNQDCKEIFIARYDEQEDGHLDILTIVGGTIQTTAFSEEIINVSPLFPEIYKQSELAEHHKLDHIAGPGYRKALEFLVKDFAKSTHPEKATTIESIQLADCIGQYINDTKTKEIARRAAWIGNDETHYVRKWTTKDINSLKSLIKLVVHFIESEELYKNTMQEMPNPKRP